MSAQTNLTRLSCKFAMNATFRDRRSSLAISSRAPVTLARCNASVSEAQRKAVEDYLNDGNWELVAEFVEIESGKDNARPKLHPPACVLTKSSC
jgi:hypothetical protein